MAKASPSKKRLLHALVVEDDPGMRQLIASIVEIDGRDDCEDRRTEGTGESTDTDRP